MARKNSINKNEKRKLMAAKFGRYRTELRNTAVNMTLSEEERQAAQLKLQKLPRDTNPNRTISRCYITGRPRGVLRKFGLCRIKFRELAHAGKIPGVTKASW